MDHGGWLRRLGLEQYEAAFRENEIDETILPKLTAEDLKDLGVSIVGHRRKLLDAIAALRTDGGAEPSSANEASTSWSSGVGPAGRAERRQVTVMFYDLVGSTALSARMDPEDLREVISAYQKCVAETVRRFDGFVAKYMGDGVLVYFGYPKAHEDDAERAVRAGLEAIAAVGTLKLSVTLQTRVGIATGLVVVGDLIGSGEARERGIIGETPNVAARLQGVAEPNGVVIAESTRRLLGNLFELTDLGSQELKGMPGSIRAWAALGPSAVEGRFDALHTGGLTELVGRQEELALLLRRWSKARAGKGQLVLLSGEPGIGKSRLTAAVMEGLASEPHTRLRYFCSPQHTDSALYPIISQMERAAGFAHDDPMQTKLDKIDALLARTFTKSQDTALLAEMLSLGNDGRYPSIELTAPQRRQKTFEALNAQLEALSRISPVLMIFEDVHWIDPTSLELLSRTAERNRDLPVLLIVTFRPEFNPPWLGQPGVSNVTLNRLGPQEVSTLVELMVGPRKLAGDVITEILERTDGIPLFVEEMTAAVLEAEKGAAKRNIASTPSPALGVPASLHASLMARLDRVGSAKEMAQVGAGIGREFSHALLTAVTRKPDAELGSALDRLISAGLLFRQGRPPHATYLFKHALVQDAAYGTLLREPRRALHARIAEVLEGQFAETVETRPELLAHHCTAAGLLGKAAGLWGKAGQRSLERSALAEAVTQLTRALDQIAALPATPALRREQIKFQIALANALIHTTGYSSPQTRTSFDHARLYIEQAEALGEPPEDSLLLFSVLFGLYVANYVAFNGDVVCGLASQFMALAEKQKAIVPLMIGHRMMGVSLLFVGDIAAGLANLEQAIARYDPKEHRPLATRFGTDTRGVVLCWRALALWVLGYPEAALADADYALTDAREVGQAATLMFALANTPYTQLCCGNYAAVNAQADEVAVLADEKGASLWKALGLLHRGCVLALTGHASDAVSIFTSVLPAFRSTGSTLFLPWFLSHLAEAYADLDQFDDARRCIGEAMTAVETTKEKWYEADVHRIAGEIALMSPERDAAKAEANFERAQRSSVRSIMVFAAPTSACRIEREASTSTITPNFTSMR
jgi:class 3 adenylate cyclase/tetratricopeptide (TPR) repeat protein